MSEERLLAGMPDVDLRRESTAVLDGRLVSMERAPNLAADQRVTV